MLDTLPVELLELLLGYLCLSDRLQLTMVSKKLNNVFWQSPIGANLRKGVKFHIDSFNIAHIQDLVNSRIFQMNAINHVELDFQYISDPEKTIFMNLWNLLAPQLTSLNLKHYEHLENVWLLQNCSRLVTLRWNYDDYQDHLPPVFPEEYLNVAHLPTLRHLKLHLNIPEDVFSKFSNKFMSIAAAESNLVTLTFEPCWDFEVLLRHVTLHAASLKSLNISFADITDQQLLSLGSVPNLRLLQLNLSRCKNFSSEGFVRFLRLQPNLSSLDIHSCSDLIFADESWNKIKNEFRTNLSGLKSLKVRASPNPKFSDFIPHLSNLQQLICWPVSWDAPLAPSLNKSSCTLLKAEFGIKDVLPLHEGHLRNLRELRLSNHGRRGIVNQNEVFVRIWQHCCNLEILDTNCLAFDADSPKAISSNSLRKLTDLTISLQMPNGWTDSLGFLLNLPNLRRLRVMFEMSPVSPGGEYMLLFCRYLAMRTPFLESLRYSNFTGQGVDLIDMPLVIRRWPRIKVASFDPF